MTIQEFVEKYKNATAEQILAKYDRARHTRNVHLVNKLGMPSWLDESGFPIKKAIKVTNSILNIMEERSAANRVIKEELENLNKGGSIDFGSPVMRSLLLDFVETKDGGTEVLLQVDVDKIIEATKVGEATTLEEVQSLVARRQRIIDASSVTVIIDKNLQFDSNALSTAVDAQRALVDAYIEGTEPSLPVIVDKTA